MLDANLTSRHLFSCSAPCCQVWRHTIVASPPAQRNAAMSMQLDAQRPMRPIYPPPPVSGPTRHAPATINMPTRNPAVMRGQGVVPHPKCQMYPGMAAAVDGRCRASAREASLAAEVAQVRQRARNEHRHTINLINESKAKLLACRQRMANAENKLMLVKVSLPFNLSLIHI